MRRLISVVVVAIAIAACGNPNDIVFGPEPLKQMAEQGDKFKKLSEEDRMLLVGYLGVSAMGKAFGADVKPVTGRTVGEVLADARAWREKTKVAQEEAKKKDAEAEALKAKALAERKAIADKISSSVTVAVVDKTVLPKNFDAGRYGEMLSIKYAVENKTDRTILQLKGHVIFNDATGDKVGSLPIEFNEPVGARKTLNTTTGIAWKMNQFMMGDIEKIASREFSSMKTTFEPDSIAFEGGEVLKDPAR